MDLSSNHAWTGGNKPKSPRLQILVVDDDARIREGLGTLLTSLGYDVATAKDGTSAVSHLDASVPDLIVTDLHLSEMCGMDLISYVRTQYPSIPIVAMSEDYPRGSVPASIIADRFYPKGQHPHHLLTAIASLIATNATRSTDEHRSRLAQDS